MTEWNAHFQGDIDQQTNTRTNEQILNEKQKEDLMSTWHMTSQRNQRKKHLNRISSSFQSTPLNPIQSLCGGGGGGG